MNLKVKDEYRVCPDPFNEWMCLRNAFTILDAIDPGFDGDVLVLMKTEGNINFLYVSIPSVSLNWGVSIDSVNENWQIGTGMTIAEAKTRIRELTSPKVDQPAPDEPKAAADTLGTYMGRPISIGDAAWVLVEGERLNGWIRRVINPWNQLNIRIQIRVDSGTGKGYQLYDRSMDEMDKGWGLLGDPERPVKAAADAQQGDRIWYIHGVTGQIEYDRIDAVGNGHITMIPNAVLVEDFGTKWGYAEEVQP